MEIINKIDPISQKNDEPFLKEYKMTDISRLSTPKPVMHLRASTEFQRQGSAIPKTSHRPGTGAGFKPTTNFKTNTEMKANSAFRPGTGADMGNRPITAVRGAGYSSHGKIFDPLNQAAATLATPLELQKDDSPEQRIRQQKNKIMHLIEESCLASLQGNYKRALSKAKEASNKERHLIRMQEEADLRDMHNIELTYAVLFTLGNQYASNEMYTEAINTYQVIIKNRMFSNSYRVKINMGHIYFRQNLYEMAIKMFRMSLDQVSSSQKNLRIKIMHNIAMVFIKMGQWEEAISSLEYIMSEQASHRAGLHLVVCCRALDDVDRMKTAFSMLLGVPLNIDDEEKYNVEQDNPEDILIAISIQNDDLHNYESKKRKEAEYCILTAAKLIAPLIDSNFRAGYDWCVASIKNSEYAKLALDLEINKAVMFLKLKQLNEAIETLKSFEKDSEIAVNAAINLTFIYYQQGDYENAIKYAEVIKTSKIKNADGFVNLGACLMAKAQPEEAITFFKNALEQNPTHFEAIYDLGLILKQQGHYLEALQCFQRFSGSLALIPEVIYHIANLLELGGDSEAAIETYQQILGLTPTDSGVLRKMGELYDQDGDKQQAHHYHIDAFRCYPANLLIIDWLGSYYIEVQVVEKALYYFEKAALMQPNEPKWNMMVAGCHRRSGNMHRALTLYQEIHRQFPENTECLRFLARLCSDLGMREANDYISELKKLEKSKEVGERVNSSRPGSKRSNSGLSSRTSSGFSPVPENGPLRSPINSGNRNLRTSKLMNLHNSLGSSIDSGYSQPTTKDANQEFVGPPPTPLRIGTAKPLDFDEFGNEELGDDLLPE